MGACLLDLELDGESQCPPPAAGLDELSVWLANKSQITFTGGTNQLYTGFTMEELSQLYRWKVHNKGLNGGAEFAENETTGAGSWAEALNFRLLGVDAATSNAVMKLRGTDLVAIVRTQSGQFLVYGSKKGLRLKTNTHGTDADTLGEAVGIGNDDSGFKHFQLLMTNEATTLAALVAAETPAPSSSS